MKMSRKGYILGYSDRKLESSIRCKILLEICQLPGKESSFFCYFVLLLSLKVSSNLLCGPRV